MCSMTISNESWFTHYTSTTLVSSTSVIVNIISVGTVPMNWLQHNIRKVRCIINPTSVGMVVPAITPSMEDDASTEIAFVNWQLVRSGMDKRELITFYWASLGTTDGALLELVVTVAIRLLMNCGVPGLLPPGLPQWQFPVPHKTPMVEDKAVIMTLATISSPINTANCLRFLLFVLPELIFWLASSSSMSSTGNRGDCSQSL